VKSGVKRERGRRMMEEGEASSFSALQHLLKLAYSEVPGAVTFI
jgi:hypothetical protein